MSDNTNDTPMDYKTPYQLLEDNHANPEMLYKMHSTDGVRLSHGKRIEKAMQEYADQQTESLKLELQKQREWKEQEIKVWLPIIEYMQSHPELRSGDSCSEFALAFLKERDQLKKYWPSVELQNQKEEIQRFELERTEMYHKYEKQKELNDDLVKFVQELLDDHRNLCFMMDFENRAESLIKKSSEI